MKTIGLACSIAVVMTSGVAFAGERTFMVEGQDDSHYYYMTESVARSVAETKIRNRVYARCREDFGGYITGGVRLSGVIWCQSRISEGGSREHLCSGAGYGTCKVYDND